MARLKSSWRHVADGAIYASPGKPFAPFSLKQKRKPKRKLSISERMRQVSKFVGRFTTDRRKAQGPRPKRDTVSYGNHPGATR